MPDKIYVNAHFGYREDTLLNWQTHNPVLERGEISFVRDGEDGKFVKIGDGSSSWNSLPFAPLPKGEKGDKGDTGERGPIGEKGDTGERGPSGINGKDGINAVTDQGYSPESENAQSGKAVAEGISEATGWETLIDVTLTEEQAGVTQIKVEADAEKLMSFTQYFLWFEFNAPQELTTNSVWLSIKISDVNSAFYNNYLGSPAGPITAVTQGEKVYGYCQTIWTNSAIQSLSTNLNKHTQANSRTNALYMNSSVDDKKRMTYAQPYLHFDSNAMQFPVGTHIVLEGRK